MRTRARAEIVERLRTGQVAFGILTFTRGNKIKKTGRRDLVTSHGTKAWVNSLVQTADKSVFIDDGEDHIRSTDSLRIKNLKSILFVGKSEKELLNFL
jgi:hypothetical protein